MKKLFTLLLLVAMTFSLLAQPPQKMSYQAVVRNSSGNLVTNSPVGIRIQILQTSEFGAAVYVETHSKTTNANGLVTLEIGGGSVVIGTFSGISWSSGPYFIKVETDPAGGTNYSITGVNQILSVPYALHANEADPVFGASPAKGVTSGNITNWNTAYGWGNHAGLYRPVGWVPGWSDITGKPGFATVATSGSYNDLSNKPTILNSQWTTNGSNIYFNSGNIGIGTSAPGSKLDVEGTINIGGGNTSELNRDQTTTANLVPICYGCVSAAGTIHAVGSTTNFTSTKTGTGVYEINISGVTVDYYNFTVSATLIGPGPAFIVTGSANAHVTVNTYNTSGTATDRAFYFVVYKP